MNFEHFLVQSVYYQTTLFMPHWLNDIHVSNHIWIAADIPEAVTTFGMHSQEITATNHFGNQYTEEVIYEIVEE